VRLVPERAMQDILGELDRFFDSATRDTHLLLYYSGHGLLDETNQLYLCARDTIKDRCRSTAISAPAINSMIEASAARATVIVLDCCHSGAFKGGDLGYSLRGAGRFQLTSCRRGELANDADQLNHASVFTSHLVEGLRGGAADENHDGFVSLGELYLYVHGRLEAEGKQIPQRHFSGGGDLAIARRGAAAAGPVEPAERPALEVSETSIELRDVHPDEVLSAERIYVRGGAGDSAWLVETTADWIGLERHENYFDVSLRPRPGVNRASVVVHDPVTREARTVRITVRVVPAPAPPAPAARGPEVAVGSPAEAPAPAEAPPPAEVKPPEALPPVPAAPASLTPAVAGQAAWTCTLVASAARTRKLRLSSGGAKHLIQYEASLVGKAVVQLDGKAVGTSWDTWQVFQLALAGPPDPAPAPGHAETAPARLQVAVHKVSSRIERFRLLIGDEQVYSEGFPGDPGTPEPESVAQPRKLSGPAEAVLAALQAAADLPDLHVHPHIPSAKLSNARRAVGLADRKPILGVLDLTVFGSTKHCIVFGDSAVHLRSVDTSETRFLYSDLPTKSIKVVKDNVWTREVDFGDGKARNVSGGALTARAIVDLLIAVKAALAQEYRRGG
jgi:hypothetical protein